MSAFSEATKYVVRQQVRTVQRAWLVDIFEAEYERSAIQEYERLKRDNPGEYFELIMVKHREEAMYWTKQAIPASITGEGV